MSNREMAEMVDAQVAPDSVGSSPTLPTMQDVDTAFHRGFDGGYAYGVFKCRPEIASLRLALMNAYGWLEVVLAETPDERIDDEDREQIKQCVREIHQCLSGKKEYGTSPDMTGIQPVPPTKLACGCCGALRWPHSVAKTAAGWEYYCRDCCGQDG